MEKQIKTSKKERQRKFLLILPLLVLPFMTMIFWALGGGKVEKAEANVVTKKGFNTNLPDAVLKDTKPMDKMSYYNQAHEDSVKFQALLKSDPHYKIIDDSGLVDDLSGEENRISTYKKGLNTSLYGRGDNDPKIEKIYRKLAELDKELSKPVSKTRDEEEDVFYKSHSAKNVTVNSLDVDRLEQMMSMMNQSSEEDPDIKQLNSVLDKILDVQHPQRVQERIKPPSEENKEKIFEVSSQKEDDGITILDTILSPENNANRFYSLNEVTAKADSPNAIEAVIHEAQTLVDGSTVKLRLVNDVFIKDVRIPKNNFIFGTVSLNGDRLNIKINIIRFNNSLFPVQLTVFDMDGLEGIYIPGAITRDVVKQSAGRSIQSMGLTTFDPSWQAQAAGAGIEAAKTLFNRKVKLAKVQMKAGYRVLLRDEKQK